MVLAAPTLYLLNAAQMADNASDADSVERVLTCTATECTRDNSVAGNIFLDNAGGTCGCP